MTFYRVYRLRGPKNEVEFFHEFEAEDDDSAIAAAERWRSLDAMELWSNHRKIHRWEPVSPAGQEERGRESVQNRAGADQPNRS